MLIIPAFTPRKQYGHNHMAEVKTVLFRNFSSEKFVGMWNKEEFPFEPNQSMHMEDWMARHFAKHLANRELLRAGMDNDTSPKKPEDNVRFMEMFNKAYIEGSESSAVSPERARLNAINLQHGNEASNAVPEVGVAPEGTGHAPVVEAPIVAPVAVDSAVADDLQTPLDDDEEEFEGLAEAVETEESKPE